MDRRGAGDVFSGAAGGQGGARMRWPAGVTKNVDAKIKNGDDDNNTGQPASGMAAGFTAITAFMRLAQRRA